MLSKHLCEGDTRRKYWYIASTYTTHSVQCPTYTDERHVTETPTVVGTSAGTWSYSETSLRQPPVGQSYNWPF